MKARVCPFKKIPAECYDPEATLGMCLTYMCVGLFTHNIEIEMPNKAVLWVEELECVSYGECLSRSKVPLQ